VSAIVAPWDAMGTTYRYFTAAGGLISYGPDLVDQYRVVASYIDRILAKSQPTCFPQNIC